MVSNLRAPFRRVDQDLIQPVGGEAIGDLASVVVVGVRELDGPEPGLGGGGDALHEGELGKQETEVGAELGHLRLSFRGSGLRYCIIYHRGQACDTS